MIWWILCIIIVALVLFLVYKRRNNSVNNVQEEHQLETNKQNNEESLPLIDIEEVTSILPNFDEEDNSSCKQIEREVSNIRHAVTPNNIEWTDELREVRRIMQLAPKKRKSILGNDTPIETKQYERYERLSVEEQYELAKQFAKLIEEADCLRNQGKLTEERSFCINAIKWCAKNGLSVIYWQCRLNQINELIGKPTIKIDSVSSSKTKINRTSPTRPIKKKKSIEKNPLLGFSVWDFDNNISKLIQQKEIEQARALCQKMIDYAKATKQERYKEKAEKVLNIIERSRKDKKKKSKFTL